MSKQKYLVMDIASCHDCNDCFMACKDEHVGNDWSPYTEEQPRHGQSLDQTPAHRARTVPEN